MALTLVWLFLAWQPTACRDGVGLFEKGRLDESARALAAATAANPASAYCAKALGAVLAAAGGYREAIGPLARACELDPAEPDACYYWARALYSLDKFDDSLAALARSKPGASKSWKLGTARGQALDALGRNEAEAVLRAAVLERARDTAPVHEPDPLLALGAFLYREGRAPEALALLKSAPPAYAKLAPFHYQMGRALAQSGHAAEAAEALAKAVALRPQYVEAHGLLSRCYYQLGQAALGARHAELARDQGSTKLR